ncbi:hypothetical protein BC830DRAFT_1126567 [Chytriomyces sp. MP71]|nr:hypothetical protein BC830DRAFT_1126567 [Chytriomyces sp. MP71]
MDPTYLVRVSWLELLLQNITDENSRISGPYLLKNIIVTFRGDWWPLNQKASTSAPMSGVSFESDCGNQYIQDNDVQDSDDGSDYENAEVVYMKRRRSGSFTAGSANSGSRPRSILKTESGVHCESFYLQMNDSIANSRYDRPVSPKQFRSVSIEPDAHKSVAFKGTVEVAFVDLSSPPALEHLPEVALFQASDVHGDYFREGGVEKGRQERALYWRK